MISNNERLVGYLDTLINSVFKVLPLYEENNEGVDTYVESLIFELYGLENVVNMESSSEYISLLSTLESIKKEVAKTNSEKKIIKREVFKSINIIKTMLNKIEGV
jgi:hypothetical protein